MLWQVSEGVNEAGIDFYNALLDTLEAANITTYVTLYHWYLPQVGCTLCGAWQRAVLQPRQ